MTQGVWSCYLLNLVVAFADDYGNVISLLFWWLLAARLFLRKEVVELALLFVLLLLECTFGLFLLFAFWVLAWCAIFLLTGDWASSFMDYVNLWLCSKEISLVGFFLRLLWSTIKLFKWLQDVQDNIFGIFPVFTLYRQLTDFLLVLINVNPFVFAFQMVMRKT